LKRKEVRVGYKATLKQITVLQVLQNITVAVPAAYYNAVRVYAVLLLQKAL
jgi:hypothetical protein